VSRRGAALSFDNAIEVLRPALPDDALILVGGQAVNYWLAYYRKSEATLMELVGVTSTDVDFLAPRESVARVAAAIGGSVIEGEPRVPNVAIVTVVDRNGQQRIIDFLNAVYGLDTKRVQTTAVEVQLLDALGKPLGVELRIMHPVLCLESRVHNTYAFPEYQTNVALLQLQAAIGCARGYVRERCDQNEIRQAHKAVGTIVDLALSDAGRGVLANHGLDPLDAIPEDERLGEALYRERLPRVRTFRGR
jgi:hypothetical protein